MGFGFQHPWALLLLVPVAIAAAYYAYGKLYRRGAAIAVSSEKVVGRNSSFRVATYRYLPVLRLVAAILLVIAIARPGRGVSSSSVRTMGVDIMIVLDVSGSMKGEDFKPKNRLSVAKDVIAEFIRRRANDRLGLVAFAGEAHFQCPLTLEHDMLGDIIAEIDFDTVREDGTAIGEALALAAARMIDSRAKSRLVLLLTDGMNNRGSIDPETAAAMCAEAGVKIYAVGIGKEGRVPYPAGTGFLFGRQYLYNHFDETMLRKISEETGGRFYRATSAGVLWDQVRDIDTLERSVIETRVYHDFHDGFYAFLLAAMIVFFVEIALRSVLYRKVP
jgi:Ca-activated chloride channel family protein